MIAAVVQARMGSTRLPGKVMKKVAGKPLLFYLINQLKHSKFLENIIIATSLDPKDDVIAKYAIKQKKHCFRGSQEDVLERHYKAASYYKVKTVVRITADCPLIDPEIIDKMIKEYKKRSLDYLTNANPPTFPDGLDVEVFSFKALEAAHKNAKLPSQREHVTPYIIKNPSLFKQSNYTNNMNLSYLRLTVDTIKDFEVVKKIIENIYPSDGFLRLEEIIGFLNKNMQILKINQGIKRNEGYEMSLKKDRELL